MDKVGLRSVPVDQYLIEAVSKADEKGRQLADKLFNFGKSLEADNALDLLKLAADASAEEVFALAKAVAPSLAPSIARAWMRLTKVSIAIPDWSIGEPAMPENRSIWLRDLLRELARYELPAHEMDALRWLAVYCGTHAEQPDQEISALIAKLLGGTLYRPGMSGSDHIGRLLACEIASSTAVSEDLLDTLKLIGTGRHPAVPSEKQFVPSPHVACGLAGSCREDAIDVLCDTIVVERPDMTQTVTAALQAVAAAVEVFNTTPAVLSRVLETLAAAIGRGKIDRIALAQPLSTLLAFPAPILTDQSCQETLEQCAHALCDLTTCERMIASQNETELFLGFWVLSIQDVIGCGERLREQYDEACENGREDTKRILRTFARFRENRSLAMRAIWLRTLAEAVDGNSAQLNFALVAEVLAFRTSAGLNLRQGISVPADEGLDMLVKLEQRLRDPALKEELAKVSGAGSAYKVDSMIAGLVVANLAGRSTDVLLPLASTLDYAGFALLATADFTKSDAATRAAIFERTNASHPNGTQIMLRAVAAASTEELVNWSQLRFAKYSVDALFAISCALRGDRIEFWRAFVLASKKPLRELGLKILIATLKVLDSAQRFEESKILSTILAHGSVDADGIRHDVNLVLDEHAAAQSKKKNGDDLKSYYVRTAREMARSENELDEEAAKQRAALSRLCDEVARITNIDRERFTPTQPQPPRDCGSKFADGLGDVAPKLLAAAKEFATDPKVDSLDQNEQYRRLDEWFDHRSAELREADGSDASRLNRWFWSLDAWSNFEQKILGRAQPMMTPDQVQRMAELRPPMIDMSTQRLLRDWARTLLAREKDDVEYQLVPLLDWYESILANLPPSIQELGPRDQNAAVPHPPHNYALAGEYRGACECLRSENVDPARKMAIYQRLWPLQWWTSSFGGRVDSLDAAAIGHAISNDQASLSELVWFLVRPEHRQQAVNLVNAAERPERFCTGIDANKDTEIRAVIQAVVELCRQQEHIVDPSLPASLANTWQNLPAPPSQATIADVLRKYGQVNYQAVGSPSDQQKVFVARVEEALDYVVSECKEADGKPYIEKPLDFDKVDAWRKTTTQQLADLLAEKVVSEELLLRIALHQPLLLRSTLEAIGKMQLLEAAIWIVAHIDWKTAELAMTLNGETGHASLRRSGASKEQLGHRLIAQYIPGLEQPSNVFASPMQAAPIRRSWKQSVLDALPQRELEPLFKALKAVRSAADRQRVEGWLDAMDGKLSSATAREKLEASIKDRPNAALLQLALLPLPSDREAMLADISKRLKIVEVVAIAGRKCKSGDARENVAQAVLRVRRTLADNAGLADPAQLDWLSGEAIAIELAEFKRCEIGDYVVALQLRSDGPQLLVSKGGKTIKSFPAALKSSEPGKRILDLQNRLKISLRETRDILEVAMIQQRPYTVEDLKMMMKHPVVEAVARELLFVMESAAPNDSFAFGLPNANGDQLLGLNGTVSPISRPVRLAHPLDLDSQGVLGAWQSWLTDQPPQPFQQVERAFVRVHDLETADDGTKIVRHDGVAIANEEQVFRILQAHGWQLDRDLHEMCRTFSSADGSTTAGSAADGMVTAVVPEFLLNDGALGPLEFRDASWQVLPISSIPPIILSETIRDIDRAVLVAK